MRPRAALLAATFALAACHSNSGGQPPGSGGGMTPDLAFETPDFGGGAADLGGGAQCQRPPLPQPQWRDLGQAAPSAAQAVLVVGSDVWVASASGLFRRPFDGSGAWQPAGLAGKMVRAIFAAKSTPGLLLAGLGANPNLPAESPLWRSLDGGASWEPVGEALKDNAASMPGKPVYDPVESFASYVESSGEIFFANGSGPSVVRSPNGKDWSYISGSPGQVCSACELHAPPGFGAFIYQGCECPLDSASIARFGVDDSTGQMNTIVGMEFLGNRRPNVLTSSPAAPATLFAGVEGGLVRLTASGPSWIYESMQGDDPKTHGYAYIRAVFVDPCVPGQLSFGGSLNGPNPVLQFYESSDDGAHVTRQDAPANLSFTDIDVVSGALSSDGRALVVATTLDHAAAHILAREY